MTHPSVPQQLELPGMTSQTKPPAAASKASPRASAFTELGFQATIAALQEEIRALYLADSVPWIVGYSGGKDSTATLQLIWSAIAELPAEQRTKTVHFDGHASRKSNRSRMGKHLHEIDGYQCHRCKYPGKT